MVKTIKEVIEGLTGIVIREGDRFNLEEEVKGIPSLHPRFQDYLRSKCSTLPQEDVKRLISIINEGYLVVKALIKDADSDHTCVRYPDADEDVGFLDEDSRAYAGYRLVLWGDMFAAQHLGGIPDFRLIREKNIRPPVIRYLKPER